MEKVQNFRNVFNDPVFFYVQFQKRYSCQTELTPLVVVIKIKRASINLINVMTTSLGFSESNHGASGGIVTIFFGDFLESKNVRTLI